MLPHSIVRLTPKRVSRGARVLVAAALLALSAGLAHAQQPPAAGGGAAGAGGAQPGGGGGAAAGVPALPAGQVGRVLVRGTPEQLEEIRRIIAENDRLPREVLLETYILDVNVSRNDNAGIAFQAFFGPSRHFGGVPLGNYSFDNRLTDANQELRFGSLSTERFAVFLNFLKNYTNTRILNRPSAMVMDGGTATLNLGGQVNYLSRVDTTVTNFGTVIQTPVTGSVNTGQNLILTPRIMPNDIVLLNITLDDTSVTEFRNFGTGNNAVSLPQTTRRALATPMYLKNGTAVVIGGLKNQRQEKQSTKIPFLGELPFIGKNFGRNLKTGTSNELVLIIKATVYAENDF